jgi:hypothetical protein
MKIKIISAAAFFTVTLSFLYMSSISNAAAIAGFSLSTDKLNYEYGAPIIIILQAQNTGTEKLTLAFSSACQTEYYIDDSRAADPICAQMLTEVSVAPGETYKWSFAHNPGQEDAPILYPGSHTIKANLIGYPSTQASQSITINYAESGVGKYCGGDTGGTCTSGLSCKLSETMSSAGGYCFDPNYVPETIPETVNPASPFKDLSSDHWAFVYIKFLADNQLIVGYDDGTFHPDSQITRAELTKMSLRAAEVSLRTDIEGSFTDLYEWQKAWVYTAQSRNIVQGYSDEIFNPNKSINRAEALKVILLAFGITQESIDEANQNTNLPFSDIADTDWFKGYIAYAYKNDILSGYSDNTFKPGNLMTRAEASKIIANIWQKLN